MPELTTMTAWDRVQLARHAGRPHTMHYVNQLCDEFIEFHGDRLAGDDQALIGGLAQFRGRSVMVIGHQKGENTKENIARNFGMPKPTGYRKALRLMRHAEKFRFPVIAFIDTPGADPGLASEEGGQAFAIADNIYAMATLGTPIVAIVIGEGGSGGALAIGVGDRTLMLEYGTYSVITPEGCASILWRDAGKAKDAAEQLGLTAKRLLGLGLIDKLVREPTGGAHRNPVQMAKRLKAVLLNELDALEGVPVDQLLQRRYKRLRGYGAYEAS